MKCMCLAYGDQTKMSKLTPAQFEDPGWGIEVRPVADDCHQ